MRPSLGWVPFALMFGAALLLPGCKKKPAASQTQAAAPSEPQGNPVLPKPGQKLESGGVIQNVRQAARRTVDLAQLKNFALAYFQYQTINGKGPSRLEDIKDSLDAKSIAAFQEGTCVAIWGLRNSSSSTIIAYVKDPDSYGTRIVATSDGSARRMNQQEFDAAMQMK